MLDRNIVVLHAVCERLGAVERIVNGARDVEAVRLTARAGHAGQLLKLLRHGGVQTLHRDAHLLQQLRHKTAVLPQQRCQQVHLLDLLVLILYSQLLRGLDRSKGLLRIFFSIHAACLLLGCI